MADKKISQMEKEELVARGFGPFGVEEVTHCVMSLPDGCKLALRVWGPLGCLTGLDSPWCLVPGKTTEGGSFPAVLEYLPYRKADWTAERDHKRHPWLASHGYVVVRADMRGSGDSDGVYYDEYLAQEQDDCCNLISWIASQPWCSGKVGMYGKSWGGFNGLQVAALQPSALSAVISLFSTDNRFEEDIHWKGGCVLGGGMISWAATMFCWDARPPQPQYNPSGWKEVWMKRLNEAGECCLKTWLEHQTYDSYWKHGSIGEDPEKVKIPVLAIGGWHDGYTRCAFRMAQTLPNCKTIVGPWSHNWPDEAKPGPNIGYMDECLAWWDKHLKGLQEGDNPPRVRWFQCKGLLPPAPGVDIWPGVWQSSDRSSGEELLEYYLNNGNTMTTEKCADLSPVTTSFSGSAGLQCGEWLSFGAPDLPGDQQTVSPLHASWSSGVLAHDIHLYGPQEVTLDCEVDCETAQVYCGLCHQFKDGKSRLLTYGLLNINGMEDDRKLVVGKRYTISVQLDPIGYTVPAGARLTLLVSPGSWPTSWAPPTPTTLTIYGGKVTLPIQTSLQEETGDMFGQPRLGPNKDVQVLRPAKFERGVKYGLSDTKKTLSVRSDEGKLYYPDVDTLIDEVNTDEYTIDGDCPTSAKALSTRTCFITYQARSGQPIHTETSTNTWMEGDEQTFVVTNSLTTKVGGVDFFSKTWKDVAYRNGV